MKHLFYIHFNESELAARLKQIAVTGVQLSGHWSAAEEAECKEPLPDIFVVSLDRLPSHGRQYVQWLWQAKKRMHIPVIFVDGKPDKVVAAKLQFPAAIFCTSEQLPQTLQKLLQRP